MNTSNAEKIAFEKGYRADEYGRVISPKGKYVSLFLNTRYLKFSLRIKGKIEKVRVHRLVAYQKYGESLYNPGIIVMHIDGISINNQYENIALGSQSENLTQYYQLIKAEKDLKNLVDSF